MNARLTALARALASVVDERQRALSGQAPWREAMPDGYALQRVAALTTELSAAGDDLLRLWLQATICGAVASRLTGLSPADCQALPGMSNPLCRPPLAEAIAIASRQSLLTTGPRHTSAGPSGLTAEPPARSADEQSLDAVIGQLSSLAGDMAGAMAGGLQFFERFLAESDASHRRRRGVYYTPPELARYIVRRIDRSLREEFGLVRGLADTSSWRDFSQRTGQPVPDGVSPGDPFVTVLDPAAGTGVFLVELIDCIHESLCLAWRGEGADDREILRRWNRYVPRHLLPRIVGLELMLPPLIVAHFEVAGKLAATGYDFRQPATLRLLPANTLAGPPPEDDPSDLPAGLLQAVEQTWHVRYRQPFTVLLGNPPYSGVSTNSGSWIAGLLRGQDGEVGQKSKSGQTDKFGRKGESSRNGETGRNGGVSRANYYQAGGNPLGERKHWLQDDYVKFLRYAHWHIERSGCGVIGMVSNHGYLDNTTFRGLREQLLATFSQVEIIDLHGNTKNKEQAPSAGNDENVFAIEQGVAVALLARPAGQTVTRRLYGELWGCRADKLRTLGQPASDPLTTQPIEPVAPHFFLVPRTGGNDRQYERAVPLTDAMPIHTTAPVTARDGLVVAFDRQELLDRLTRFRDLSIPDDEIRRDYFQRRRSWRYPPGDTRGWQLSAARRQLAELPDWSQPIRGCLYRPFDFRHVYWTDWMIDWPRSPVMRHLLDGTNLALIARRQMLPDQPCTFFWICDRIALDGVIRSDNRGSESLFPLYLSEPDTGRLPLLPSRTANFSDRFQQLLAERIGPDGSLGPAADDDREILAAEEILFYIYGLFHAPTYRVRYAEQLRREFPRILLPANRRVFQELARLGKQIADCHLMRSGDDRRKPGQGALKDRPSLQSQPCLPDELPMPYQLPLQGPVLVQRRRLRYDNGTLWFNDRQALPDVPPDVWQFQAGGHQVCRKWLVDRDGRQLNEQDLRHYQRLLASVATTRQRMQAIDQFINSQGGWETAFAG